MIEILLNGEKKTLPSEQSVSVLMRECGVPSHGVAVAVNYTVIPKSQYVQILLHHNDAVEIITATAGG
jgi:sulfur carrier protein